MAVLLLVGIRRSSEGGGGRSGYNTAVRLITVRGLSLAFIRTDLLENRGSEPWHRRPFPGVIGVGEYTMQVLLVWLIVWGLFACVPAAVPGA
ncbi:MAG TPA: hypothetical protein VI542_26020 [Candidatus Tectomicrobia bacterium]